MLRILKAAAAALVLSAPVFAQDIPAPTRSGHVDVDGVSYYWDVRGQGEPLLLLHGGLGAIEMFGPVLARLAAERTVIGIDLQGHGRTTLGDRPIRYGRLGDDMGRVLEQIVKAPVDVLGYSMGGAVALELALQHPGQVRRLVVASAGFDNDSFYPELKPMQAGVGAGMAEMMKGTPMHDTYMALAPVKDDFPRLLDAMGDLMRTPWSARDRLAGLQPQTMLVYGDSDMIRLDHVVEFYNLIGGGLKDAGWQREHMAENRLAILPDLTHYELFASPKLADAVLPFLDGESGATSWAETIRP
jgi:pimeloyl-ACP methyl ester carboxylesterase